MAHGNKFASGKYAWAMCDLCGVRCKYRDLREPTIRGRPTGNLVCPTCYDPDHPQNFLPEAVTVDAQALRNARPDTGLAASRIMYPNNNWLIPPYPPAAPGERSLNFQPEDQDAAGSKA